VVVAAAQVLARGRLPLDGRALGSKPGFAASALGVKQVLEAAGPLPPGAVLVPVPAARVQQAPARRAGAPPARPAALRMSDRSLTAAR
jgi:hypothetical protein